MSNCLETVQFMSILVYGIHGMIPYFLISAISEKILTISILVHIGWEMLVSNIVFYQYFLIMHVPFRANSAVMTAN